MEEVRSDGELLLPKISPGKGSKLSFVPINRRAGRETRRRGASAVAQSTAAGVPGQELTTSAQHSSLFIVVPGKPQALGGGGCGVSATHDGFLSELVSEQRYTKSSNITSVHSKLEATLTLF
ncbi:hypothetical protein MG293_010068 [Ovis ammon polii]|uniref:Uncharacterized protein n=1 Tax=Ovis ammon polii TaxID=230172 RepID=A0AAD4U3D3_OVIAM|nr:hypothetical protein MG293_010068 [Ovis ammon polii]